MLSTQIWDINVKSTALLVKEAYPHFKANKSVKLIYNSFITYYIYILSRGGSVVLVSSIGAYAPFSVSVNVYKPTQYSSLTFFSLCLSGSRPILCEQDSFGWVDKGLSSGTCSRQYSSQLHCTRDNSNKI